jgi:hypothetical protein
MDTSNNRGIRDLIDADLQDSLDEELELELDDRELEQFRKAQPVHEGYQAPDRHIYFRELLGLQGELVKLQARRKCTCPRSFDDKMTLSIAGRFTGARLLQDDASSPSARPAARPMASFPSSS